MGIASLLKRVDAKTSGLHELTDDELLKMQNVLTDMMQDIAMVCEGNGISWSLFGGSALGAVRHKGFIPWDDDIDIYMMREEYNKFRDIFPQTLGDKYELKEPGDSGYLFHYPMIYKKGTKAKTIQSNDNAIDGIFIDIFIMENVYNNILLRIIHGIECTIYSFIDSVLRVECCKDNILKYGSKNKQLRREVKLRLFFAKFFHFLPFEEWLRRSDRCFSKVKNGSKKLVVAPSGVLHYWHELYNKEKMETLVRSTFLGKEFYIMKDYDYYLKKRYGTNYMVPPQEGEREKHVFIEFDLGE